MSMHGDFVQHPYNGTDDVWVPLNAHTTIINYNYLKQYRIQIPGTKCECLGVTSYTCSVNDRVLRDLQNLLRTYNATEEEIHDGCSGTVVHIHLQVYVHIVPTLHRVDHGPLLRVY